MEVLIVDDELPVRESVGYALRTAGFDIKTAVRGDEAYQILKSTTIQIVVSDWTMPGINGLDLCRAVRQSDFRRYVYFIVLTGHDQPDDILAGLAAGVDDYVKKPFDPRELILRVNNGKRIINIESRNMVIFTLAKVAESRDPETGAHLDRVRGYCQAICKYLQTQAPFQSIVDEEYVRSVYETCPLHDIGKVSIPDRILLKPGALTADEYEEMKTHTTRGAEMLASAIREFPNATFLRMAHDIALTHHERYDGSGYPHRLSGQSIPLCGRIVALADVYDALTSKRVYKHARAHQFARSEIVNGKGRQFDPAIVDAFLAVEAEFIAINKRYDEHTE